MSQCGVCLAHAALASSDLVAWQSDRWLLRHHASPAPLAGWFLLDARRHVQSAADFDAAESREFAGVLGASIRAIKAATGVPRVYTIMFGEGAPHLHAHLVPRDPLMSESCAWKVADLYREVERGIRPAAPADAVLRVVQRVRSEMSAYIIDGHR